MEGKNKKKQTATRLFQRRQGKTTSGSRCESRKCLGGLREGSGKQKCKKRGSPERTARSKKSVTGASNIGLGSLKESQKNVKTKPKGSVQCAKNAKQNLSQGRTMAQLRNTRRKTVGKKGRRKSNSNDSGTKSFHGQKEGRGGCKNQLPKKKKIRTPS